MKLFRYLRRVGFTSVLLCTVGFLAASSPASAQETRKPLVHPAPPYPDLARRMEITGVVKVQITIGADGKITDMKFLGGHPLLIGSVETTLKDWKYAPASEETTTVLEFHFKP